MWDLLCSAFIWRNEWTWILMLWPEGSAQCVSTFLNHFTSTWTYFEKLHGRFEISQTIYGLLNGVIMRRQIVSRNRAFVKHTISIKVVQRLWQHFFIFQKSCIFTHTDGMALNDHGRNVGLWNESLHAGGDSEFPQCLMLEAPCNNHLRILLKRYYCCKISSFLCIQCCWAQHMRICALQWARTMDFNLL